MPYYRSHFPSRTALMDYRAVQAKKAGKRFTVRYKPVPLKSISPMLRRGVVVAEDAKFYKHGGLDYDAIEDAYRTNQRKGRIVRGGSTISQQVAKNIWLTPERTYWRKLIEAILTYRMEFALSKDRVLELYLNIVEWGPGVFGAAAASEVYFKTSPGSLTPQQAALLAAAIPSPLRFNPTNPSGRIQRSQGRILAALVGREEPAKSLKLLEEPPPEPETPQSTPSPLSTPAPEISPEPPTPDPALPAPEEGP
jgi:monofunctional biosynthetic peptidoglycan transglycosylase